MDKLAKTELFNLLMSNSQTVTNLEMQRAYENFKEQVRNLNQSENDYNVIFRSLSSTRIELKILQADILNEQGKKCA